jgi:uncharacterized protein (TIGR02757 family)
MSSQVGRWFRVDKERLKLKKILEGLYRKYNRRELIKPDPLQFVYQYNSPSDKEIVAFLSAALAYGRVEQIEKSLSNLFARMGKSPYAFVRNFDKTGRKKLSGFKHRFTTGQDISDLLTLLKKVLSRYGSIQEFFVAGFSPNDKNIIPALTKFCDSLYVIYKERHNGKVSRGLKFLLASPSGGSACKRLNLFLRWMVRKDDVDPGLWKSVDKAKLIVPVDVHIGRLCRILGFYPVRSLHRRRPRRLARIISNGVNTHKTASLSAAIQITESFATVEPADPVKYDFALSRIGITEGCNGKYRTSCEGCEIFDFCHSLP